LSSWYITEQSNIEGRILVNVYVRYYFISSLSATPVLLLQTGYRSIHAYQYHLHALHIFHHMAADCRDAMLLHL